jgi:hypothetical protein
MKWNWGTKLVIAMAAFMLMVIAFVVFMFSQDVSLVEPDYYPRAIAFQQRLDKVENTRPYNDSIIAQLSGTSLTISFPDFFEAEKVMGNVHFYNRISDQNDQYAALDLDEEGIFSYPIQNLNKGRYILKISWVQDGINYYTEKSINMN